MRQELLVPSLRLRATPLQPDHEVVADLWAGRSAVLKTGNKIWSTPSYFEGVVYLTSFDNYIYAIDLIEGTLIWKFESDGAIVSSPVIIGDNLFFGSFGTTFYALDRKTGNEK